MTIIPIAILGFALAEEPKEPVRPDAFPNECPSAIGITSGQPFNAIDTDYRATCSGVLLPTSEVFYLQKVKSWASENDAYLRAQIADRDVGVAEAKSAAVRSRKATLAVSGVAIAALTVAVVGWKYSGCP